jgi:hypothetical protein
VSHTGFKLVSRVIIRNMIPETDTRMDANASSSWRKCFIIASLLICNSMFGLDLCSAD